MEFKIDTKEKFYVVEPKLDDLTAIMAEEIAQKVFSLSENEPFNVILKLPEIQTMEDRAADILANCRIEVYESQHSFVVCCLSPYLSSRIEELEMEDAWNITPTESEAWDIVQMDEMEREFLNGDMA